MKRDRRTRGLQLGLLALLVAIPLLISASVAARPTSRVATVGANWELAFSDDFDDALDPDRWFWCYWWVTNGCAIGTNGELEWYQPGNISVADGVATLTARPEVVTTHEGEPRAFTSGMLTTGRSSSDRTEPPRFAFTYGWAEIRAKLPAGQGLWPAFWLLPVTHESRPEIDVMEVLGQDPTTLRLHYHFSTDGERSSVGHRVKTADLTEDWHVYAVEWTPNHVAWFLDGQEVWRIAGPDNIPHEPMYLIVNLAVGGDWQRAPDAATEFPAEYEIDYVRVWQYPES